MAEYTVRFAHLRYPCPFRTGDEITRGDLLGVMGNTGQSTGNHIHIDVVRGRVTRMYHMHDITPMNLEPDFKQLTYFIDEELGGPFRVTTYAYDYRYKFNDGEWKPHPGYDIVLERSIPRIYWNRSMPGEVLRKGFDPGYGNFAQIGFEA